MSNVKCNGLPKEDGYPVISGPRTTEDGYYKS